MGHAGDECQVSEQDDQPDGKPDSAIATVSGFGCVEWLRNLVWLGAMRAFYVELT